MSPLATARGVACLILLLQLAPSCWGQNAHNVGQCECNRRPIDVTQNEIATYLKRISNMKICPDGIIIGFYVGRKSKGEWICGSKEMGWVNKLQTCINTRDSTQCFVPEARTQAPNHVLDTIMSVNGVTTSAVFITTTVSKERGIVSQSSSSSLEAAYFTGSITNTPSLDPNKKDESGSQGEQEEGIRNEMHTRASEGDGEPHKGLEIIVENTTHLKVAVISLLGVVFVLVAVGTFLICRKRSAPPKYDPVEPIHSETESV